MEKRLRADQRDNKATVSHIEKGINGWKRVRGGWKRVRGGPREDVRKALPFHVKTCFPFLLDDQSLPNPTRLPLTSN